MTNFFNYIIKGIITAVVGGVIAIGGIFSHKPAQTPQPATPPAAVRQTSTESIGIGHNAFVPEAVTANKPATTTKTTKPAPAQPSKTEAATVIPPITISVPQIIQPSQPAQPSLPPVIQINPETFVGILCYFNAPGSATSTAVNAQTAELLVRGSGVIVNSKGYILTNRHIVLQTDANGNNYRLDHCDIGQLPQGTHLPTVDEIKSINPLVRVPVLAYSAQPVFDSSSLPLDSLENDYADFAILKITGVSADGPSFGFTSVPASFPYAKLLPVDKYDIEGQGVVTYGFPGDVTTGQNDAFQTLTMEGSVGTVSQVEVGDSYYTDVPLVIMTNMEISHGRSGSPLFWRGYVIGLTTFYMQGNRTDSGSVASDAIIKGLEGTGYLEQ